MADLARRATRWVGTFPYILTPIPNLYDHSFPRYGQITFLTFRRPTTLTFDLKFCQKIFVSHGVPIRNMYAKFHNDRLKKWLRYYTLKFCENTDKQTHKHTHKQTNTHTNRHGHYNTSPSPYGGRGNYKQNITSHLHVLLILLLPEMCWYY